jgi:hypothetical protein
MATRNYLGVPPTELTAPGSCEAGSGYAARLSQTRSHSTLRPTDRSPPCAPADRHEQAVITKSDLVTERLPMLARARVGKPHLNYADAASSASPCRTYRVAPTPR